MYIMYMTCSRGGHDSSLLKIVLARLTECVVDG